ncbi:hypothetical protein [Mesorhizobium sp. M00.F.Ca.ET.216.01.1.1]|nr:hypothetical protein [Mesorhizobium sp. M00.F.Ca.ET.216.01.1.1]
MPPKPELGIQFGASGDTSAKELEAEGTKDVGWLVAQAGVPSMPVPTSS